MGKFLHRDWVQKQRIRFKIITKAKVAVFLPQDDDVLVVLTG